jgi:hypothetical protein
MTCIVGLVDNGIVYLGGDAAGVDGWYNRTIMMRPKVFRKEDMVIGYTTSFRMGQLLEHSLTIPPHYGGVDIWHYMVHDFIGAVRQCLRDGGFAEKDKEVEKGGEFLVGFRGRLFKIASTYQIQESLYHYDAAGCAGMYAMGVLGVMRLLPRTAGRDMTPEDKLTYALKIAAKHSAGVCEPFTIVSTTKTKESRGRPAKPPGKFVKEDRNPRKQKKR